MDTSEITNTNPTKSTLPPRKIEIIRTRLHANTKKHCYANALTLLVPKGHGQATTDLLMKAHALKLHTSLPGTYIAKGMIDEHNQNFIEERILHQNKVNNQSAHLKIYKLT